MGTSEGARKFRDKQLKKDPDYYKKLGSKGGKKSTNRPFKDTDFAKQAGSKGGQAKRKKKA